jgi:hypothetical protein
MSNKSKLHDGQKVHVIVQGTSNARVKRLSDGKIYKVPLGELKDDPDPEEVPGEAQVSEEVAGEQETAPELPQTQEELVSEETEHSPVVTPMQPYTMGPVVDPEPEAEMEALPVLDMRSIRKGLRPTVLEKTNQVGRGPRGPFPTHIKRAPKG